MAWQHPYTWFIGISNVSKTSLTGYHPGRSPEFACTGLSIYLISKQPDYIRLFVGICHSVKVPAIRFCSAAVVFFSWYHGLLPDGQSYSITSMNYSVTIFVYSRWYAIRIMLSQNCDIAGYLYFDIRKGACSLPDTDILKSPFADVYK